MNFVQGKEQDPIGWTKAKMKDFIKNIPKEDEDHTLLIGMDKIKCIWKREDNIFPNPLFPIIEITTKDKIKKKK